MIPLFKEYSIKGIKSLDFKYFCEVVELIYNKVHLTRKGLEKTREIQFGMYRGRIHIIHNP